MIVCQDDWSCMQSAGGDVLELQRFLHDQGYFPRLRETPDGYTGYFGDLTKEALQAWQEDYHLNADGQFGQSCRQAFVQIQVGRLALTLALPVVIHVYMTRLRAETCLLGKPFTFRQQHKHGGPSKSAGTCRKLSRTPQKALPTCLIWLVTMY